MKYSREYILKRAFDVFISKGYDSTSISILQQELNMSRGAMYRYFKNKEDLFFAVIDRYFFRLYSKALKDLDNEYSALELIEEIHRRNKISVRLLYRTGLTRAVFLNYTALIIQAAKYYPNFLAKFKEIQLGFIRTWKKALIKSIERGEIKSDIDINIMSHLFNSISIRESSEVENMDQCTLEVNVAESVLIGAEARRKSMLYIYDLIKK